MLKVVRAAAVAANTPFTVTVPAQEIWTVQSVCATVSRAVGGAPNRSYRLTITDGTSTLLSSPAADAGSEPGTATVTWTNATPTAQAAASTGVCVGPLPTPVLLPGYVIAGTVLAGVATDQWTVAAVWLDFRFTN